MEFEVWGTPLQNLAATANVTASGYTNPNESPDKAKDGNTTTTKWCDADPNNKWLMYDLGSSSTIKKFVLNWEDWDINPRYRIQTSTDANNWKDVIIETANTTDPKSYDVNLTGVRYVRFYVADADDADAVRLMEFEVWGTKP